MHDDSELPQRSGTFRAVVRVGATITEYLRSGRGRPVLMLRPPEPTGPLWDELLATTAGSLKVIVPEVMPQADDPAAWFAAFLDGLGLQQVAVVAHGVHASLTYDLAARDPERISRCILIDGQGPPPRQPLTQPLLLLPADGDVADTVEAVVRFLAGDPDAMP